MKLGSAGKCAIRFVASRTRVAPLNSLTIPRLELLAALLLARLLSNTMQALQKFDKTSCYTDSKIVLYWIRGYDKEWKQFVENRVREIRTLIPAKCWHHCRGDLNPANLPSRGVEGTEPSAIGSWLKVPQHVFEPDQEPCSSELNTIPEACAMELKVGDQTSSMTVHSVVEKLVQGLVRCASLRVRSGTTTILLNCPLQHLYPLEIGAPADQMDRREPDEPTVVTRRSQPTRVAAQVARLRIEEQLN